MGEMVASNAKYYKASQMAGLTGHVKRAFEDDENVYPDLSGENFNHHFADFSSMERRMIKAKSDAGLRARGFQKNANVLVDNILILSRDVVDRLKQENPDGYKAELTQAAVMLAESIRDKFGLEPLSIDFHWDEGHFDKETGEFKNNYHAHMHFINFDFKQLNQPLRKMKRSDFSIFQDLSVDAFEHLGFERGKPKKLTGNKRLEKSDFVIEEHAKQKRQLEQEIKEQIAKLENKNQELNELNQKVNRKKQEIEQLNPVAMKLHKAQILVDSFERSQKRFKAFLELDCDQRVSLELKVAKNRLQELERGSEVLISDRIDELTQNFTDFLKPR